MHIYRSQAHCSKLLLSDDFLSGVLSNSVRCHFSENQNTKLMFTEDKQGCKNSTVALRMNLNTILTHEFPFSSVKAELPLRCGNNKEKILLLDAPKNRLAEALVGSLL